MTTFALVHGAWHGGWHWHAVVDRLVDQGHRVVAPDVPFDRPDTGAVACAHVMVDALRAAGDVDEPVVIVGHSYGGLVVPVLATLVPTSRMVFLAGLLPRIGLSAADGIPHRAVTERFSSSLNGRLETFEDGSSAWTSLTDAAETLYDELPRGVALVAASHLRRQYYRVWDEMCPLDAWPDVPSSYLLLRHDLVLSPTWMREVCRSQLGVPPIELEGGHSPFLARPGELVEILLAVSNLPDEDLATG